MHINEFCERAILRLINNQKANGTWYDDEIMTYAVLEALFESEFGPFGFIRTTHVYDSYFQQISTRYPNLPPPIRYFNNPSLLVFEYASKVTLSA